MGLSVSPPKGGRDQGDEASGGLQHSPCFRKTTIVLELDDNIILDRGIFNLYAIRETAQTA